MGFPTWDRVVFVDTEKTGEEPWSVQADWGDDPKFYLVTDLAGIRSIDLTGYLVVVHNALFDIPVLRAVGIDPPLYADTMVMAYLLGMDTIGLKTLAYRLCNIHMREFEAVVAPATRAKALKYLRQITEMSWPDPDPVAYFDPQGVQKVKWPQNIRKKVNSLLKKHDADPTINLYEKWGAMEWEGGRGQVEERFGKMEQGWLADIPRETAEEYALGDVVATRAIFPILWTKIQELGLEDTFWRDMGAMEMVMAMESEGCLLDLPFFHNLSGDLAVELERMEGELTTLVGRKVNPNSSKQVANLLNEMEIPVKSTESSELDRHRDKPVVRLIQDCRGLGKLIGTYVDKFPWMVDSEGRLHTRLSMTRTDTGRLASSKPNLQNIPVRTEWGKKVRRGFVAGPGNVLVSWDFSQIEMRLAAHESQDDYMLQLFRDDADIHTMTASRMFRKKPEDIDAKKERYPAKRTGFGVLYGITGAGLLDVFYHEGVTAFSETDCDHFISAWFDTFPGIREWEASVRGFAIRNGYVVDLFGRRRWIPEVESVLPYVKEAGIRQAINAPIQSGAQGIIKEAMRLLTPAVKAWNGARIRVSPLLQIHDELLFEVDEDVVEVVVPQFLEIMTSAVELSVPLKADAEVGCSWLDMVEYDEWKEKRDEG